MFKKLDYTCYSSRFNTVPFDLRLWKWHADGPPTRWMPASNLSLLAVLAFLLCINGALIEKVYGCLIHSTHSFQTNPDLLEVDPKISIHKV